MHNINWPLFNEAFINQSDVSKRIKHTREIMLVPKEANNTDIDIRNGLILKSSQPEVTGEIRTLIELKLNENRPSPFTSQKSFQESYNRLENAIIKLLLFASVIFVCMLVICLAACFQRKRKLRKSNFSKSFRKKLLDANI